MSINDDLTKRYTDILDEQIPDFIRNDHPKLVEFLRAYYKWLEESDNVHEILFKTKKTYDIDKTEEEFLRLFHTEFLNNLPQNLEADKRNLIKNIADVYRAKGTEAAYKLFFKAIYNDDIELYYPKVDILRTSDGKWIGERQSIRVNPDTITGATDNIFDLQSKTIVQKNVLGETIATGVVDSIIVFTSLGQQIAELFLVDNTGEFDCFSGENILAAVEETEDTEIEIFCIINEINITNSGSGYMELEDVTITGDGIEASAFIERTSTGPVDGYFIEDGGENYQVGDTIIFNNDGSGGAGASAQVTEVAPSSPPESPPNATGAILSISINSGGFGYKSAPLVDRIDSDNGDGAIIRFFGSDIGKVESVRIRNPGFGYTISPPPTVTFRDPADDNPDTLYEQAEGEIGFGAEFTRAGFWENDDGMLNEKNFLQDSFYYQEFSYVIRSGQPFSLYEGFVNKLLHPAGQKLFGEVDIFLFINLLGSAVFTVYFDTITEAAYEANNIFNEDTVNGLGMDYEQLILGQHMFPVWNQEQTGTYGNTQIKDFAAQKAPWTVDELTIADTIFGHVLELSSVTGNLEPGDIISISNFSGTFEVLSWDDINNLLYIVNDKTIPDITETVGESITGVTSAETGTIVSARTQRSFPLKMQWDTNMVHLIDNNDALRYVLHYDDKPFN